MIDYSEIFDTSCCLRLFHSHQTSIIGKVCRVLTFEPISNQTSVGSQCDAPCHGLNELCSLAGLVAILEK